MAAIVYTFSATGKESVIRAFKDIETAAAHTARTVQKLDKKMSRVAKSTSKQRKLAAKEASASAISGLTKELKGLKKLARELKNLSKAEKKRGADAVAASKAAAAQKAKEAAANKALAASNRRAAAQMGRLRSFSGGTGMIGVGATGALFGAMAVGAAGRQAVELEEAVASLAIKGRKPGQRANVGSLMRRIQATSMANPGVKSLDLTKGMMAFVSKTGDLPGAKKYMNTFATVGSATGTDMEDLGRVMAEMQIKMGIKDPKEMMTGLSMMAVAGKRNRIELSDLAKYLPKMASAMTRFSGRTGFDAVKSLSSMIQIGAQGSGTAAGAATSMERAYANVAQAQHTGKLSKLGVNAFRKGSRSKFRDMEDILSDILYATDNRLTGDATDAQGNKIKKKDRKVALMDIFKQRGIRYTSGFSRKWDQLAAGEDQGGVKRTAIETKKAFDEFIQSLKVGSEAVTEIMEDHAIKQETTSAQLTAAWEKVTAEVSKELLPTLKGLAGNKDAVDGLVVAIKGMTIAMASLASLVGFVADQFGFLNKAMDAKRGKEADDAFAAGNIKEKLQLTKDRRAAYKKKWDASVIPKSQADISEYKGTMAGFDKEVASLEQKQMDAEYGMSLGAIAGLTTVQKDKEGNARLFFNKRGRSKESLVRQMVKMGVPEAKARELEEMASEKSLLYGTGGRHKGFGDDIARRTNVTSQLAEGAARTNPDFKGDVGRQQQFRMLIANYLEGRDIARAGGKIAGEGHKVGGGETQIDKEGNEIAVSAPVATIKTTNAVFTGVLNVSGVPFPTAHPQGSPGTPGLSGIGANWGDNYKP